MRLVLHIGTHKTATTSVQAALASNRASLREAGIWYPSYSEVFPGMTGARAHLDLAKGLSGDSGRFTPELVAQFFELLHKEAVAARDLDTVLISAEPFYRGKLGDTGSYWEQRERYIREVRSVVPFEDTRVVIVVRRQDDYLESLYNEHVKATRYSQDIWSFFHGYRSRLEYRQQIEAWSRHFPAMTVATFEDLVSAGDVTTNFLAAAVDGREVALAEPTRNRNASLPIDLTEFKRYMNGTDLSLGELRDLVRKLQAMADARTGQEPGRRSRLSEDDCARVLAEFADDNQWICERYFAARPGGLFPTGIRPRQTVEPLDMPAFAGIVAELLRGGPQREGTSPAGAVPPRQRAARRGLPQD